jgi:DNA-binding NarL/FixJ family response regulator
MIMRGLPNKRIAAQLSISEPTVKEHISNILKKIGVNSRVEAITFCMASGNHRNEVFQSLQKDGISLRAVNRHG